MKSPTPIAKAALSFRTRALKLPRAKREVIDALIKRWHPGYLGWLPFHIPFDDPRHKLDPHTSLVLWEEVECRDAALASCSKWSLYERAKWSLWGSFRDTPEAVSALHLLRALTEADKECSNYHHTLTLTVAVEDPAAPGNRQKTRYIDVETGREWIAQCWTARQAAKAGQESGVAA